MNIFIICAIIIGALILTVILIGALLPRKVHVSRSIRIQSTPEIIYPELVDYHKFITWSPWSKKDPNMKQNFEGTPMTVGASYSWSGNKQVKTGKMITRELIENRFVKQELDFGYNNETYATYELRDAGNEVEVCWTVYMDMGANPISHIFGSMMDKFIGKDFSDGLTNLKQKIEQNHA